MGDIETLQSGGTTEFNSNVQTIIRLNNLWTQANTVSMGRTLSDCHAWFSILSAIDREIHPLLNDQEKKDIDKLRRKAEVPQSTRENPNMIRLEKEELDRYERELRQLTTKKGLGVRAGLDAGKAIMR